MLEVSRGTEQHREGAGVSIRGGPGLYTDETPPSTSRNAPGSGVLAKAPGQSRGLHAGLPGRWEPASTELGMDSAELQLFIQPLANIYWRYTMCQARPYSFRCLVPTEPYMDVHPSIAAAERLMGGVGKPRVQLLSPGVGGVTGTTFMLRRKP